MTDRDLDRDPRRAASGLMAVVGDLRCRGEDGLADHVVRTHDGLPGHVLELLTRRARHPVEHRRAEERARMRAMRRGRGRLYLVPAEGV